MKLQQKLSSFYWPKRTSVEPEKHKDGLDKDGVEAGEVSLMTSVVQRLSLNIIVWSPQTIFEMTQFLLEGCKETHFYSLPFGQAEASIY